MERNYLFDNMKVLLIFSVVLAHFVRVSGFFQTNSPAGVIYITAFSFIMQGFLFISGFFSKNTDKCRKGSIKNFLLPYFVLMAAMFAVRHIIFGTAELDFARPSHALWFLLVMFVYRFCIKDLQRIPGVLFVSLILMLGSGCFPIFGERLAAGRLLAFLFFFMLGFRLEWRHIVKIRRIPKRYIVLLL